MKKSLAILALLGSTLNLFSAGTEQTFDKLISATEGIYHLQSAFTLADRTPFAWNGDPTMGKHSWGFVSDLVINFRQDAINNKITFDEISSIKLTTSIDTEASTLPATEKAFGLRLWVLEDSTKTTAYDKLQEAMETTESIFDTGLTFSINDLNDGILVKLTEAQEAALGKISDYSNILIDLYLDSSVTTKITFNKDKSSIIFNEGAIPEPSTYAVAFGLLALGFVAYRKRK